MTDELQPGDQVTGPDEDATGEVLVSLPDRGIASVRAEDGTFRWYAISLLTKVEPEPEKTLSDKLEASFDVGTLGGETWYPDQAFRVFQDHFNSKADDINTLIARESDVCSDLAGDIRGILFGDES